MSFQFLAEPGRVKLPPLALWEPSTRVVRTDDGLVTLDVGALPQRLGGELPTIMYGARDGSIIWVAPPQESGGFFGFGSSESKAAPVDHRVLEDAGAWVVAEVEVTRDGRPLKGELVYRSAQRRLKGPGAPPSRHAGCSVLTPKVRRIRYDSCPFTDGDFDNAVDMQQAVKKAGCLKKRCKARKRADKARVMIDLGGQRDIELVVLRSDSLNYVIEASTDGTRWTRVGEATTSSGQAMVRPPSAVGGRYLRVRSHGMSHSFLREISVW